MIIGALIGVILAGILLIIFNPNEPTVDSQVRMVRSTIRLISTVAIVISFCTLIGYWLS